MNKERRQYRAFVKFKNAFGGKWISVVSDKGKRIFATRESVQAAIVEVLEFSKAIDLTVVDCKIEYRIVSEWEVAE